MEKKMIKELILGIIIVGIVSTVAYGLWNLKRKVNYSFGYESMVHEQIQDETKELKMKLDRLEKRFDALEAGRDIK
jgi:hypothetical protein